MVWGTTWVAVKISVGNTPFFAAGLRFIIAGTALILFQIARSKTLKPSKGSWPLIIALILGNFFVGYASTYTGMKYIYSNLSSLIWATMPVMVSIFAHFMIASEKFNFQRVISLALSMIGLLLFFDLETGNISALFVFGVAVTLLGVIAASASNVYYKKHIMESHDAVILNAYSMLIASAMHFMVAFLFEDISLFQFTQKNILAILYLAILGSSYTFVVFFSLIRHYPVVTMSYITFVIPIVAVIMGWVFLGEALSQNTLLGGVLILTGVLIPSVFSYYKTIKNGHS